jgi:hypothetical protein
MIIACLSCSQLSVLVPVFRERCEASSDKSESCSASEPDSASLHQWEWSTIRIWRNLLPMVKQQVQAAIGLPGVIEDSAHGQSVQEPGRPCEVRDESQHDAGNHNRIGGLVWESEKPIVAMKRSNVCGAKGLYCKRARVERGGVPLV